MFSIEHSTISPDFRNCGGSIPRPTPAGVPVNIISPALRVSPLDKSEIIVAISNIRFLVFEL